MLRDAELVPAVQVAADARIRERSKQVLAHVRHAIASRAPPRRVDPDAPPRGLRKLLAMYHGGSPAVRHHRDGDAWGAHNLESNLASAVHTDREGRRCVPLARPATSPAARLMSRVHVALPQPRQASALRALPAVGLPLRQTPAFDARRGDTHMGATLQRTAEPTFMVAAHGRLSTQIGAHRAAQVSPAEAAFLVHSVPSPAELPGDGDEVPIGRPPPVPPSLPTAHRAFHNRNAATAQLRVLGACPGSARQCAFVAAKAAAPPDVCRGRSVGRSGGHGMGRSSNCCSLELAAARDPSAVPAATATAGQGPYVQEQCLPAETASAGHGLALAGAVHAANGPRSRERPAVKGAGVRPTQNGPHAPPLGTADVDGLLRSFTADKAALKRLQAESPCGLA